MIEFITSIFAITIILFAIKSGSKKGYPYLEEINIDKDMNND